VKLSPNEIAWVGQKAGFTGNDLVIFVAVCLAESDGDTDALGHRSTSDPAYGNYDHGLVQISNKWHSAKLLAVALKGEDWRDPYVNARLGKQAFDEFVKAGKVGWTAWSTYNPSTKPDGTVVPPSYLKYLPAAKLAVVRPFPPIGYAEAVVRKIARAA
jgi:hypothetical protein